MAIPGVIEAILIEVGSALAEHVFAAKVRKRRLVGSIQDFLTQNNHSIVDSRKAQRQFDQIAESFANGLQTLLVSEGVQLPEHELTSALLAVRDSFARTELGSEVLMSVDVDPGLIEQRVRIAGRQALQTASLSDNGAFVYDRVLRECCNYLAEFALKLPDLHGKLLREVLARQTDLAASAEEILRLMPTAYGAGDITTDGGFELEYRREIARRLDELQLFGLDVSDSSQRYPLTVAYISLALNPIDQALGTQVTEDDEYESAEAVIARNRKIVIRGDAGSGKTTLLQRMAVSAARRDADDQDLWRSEDPIPFFLQLRRYVDRDLPLPSQFLAVLTPALSDQMPSNWVSRTLSSGRGVVLIDGLDELPATRRTDVREWLDDLAATYPQCRFVVTSRPSGLPKNWAKLLHFEEAELLPMSAANVGTFIDHWHAAAADDLRAGERDELLEYAPRLKTLVATSVRIRSLATSPLLCAMLCALHRDRRTQVPADRLELYRIALETLLDRRDKERSVETLKFSLSLPQKLILLQDIAYWLQLNDQSDATVSEIHHRLAERLQALPDIKATADEMLAHLLERTGVLREPVIGRVDFLHRTFQEYLAAKEAVTQNHIPMLINRATDDQWMEVVVLSCGHASNEQRAKLISGLLERGDNNQQHKHVLHLIAVACLETSVELDRRLRSKVLQAMRGVVPPKSMSEAKAVASAGELAVPALRGHRRANANIVTACVRALALIGGEAALHAIAEYGADRRKTVWQELIRAWSSFDSDDFAATVMTHSPIFAGGVSLNDPDFIAATRSFTGRARISAQLPQYTGADLDQFSDHPHITVLRVPNSPDLRDISAVSTLPNLKTLNLTRCTGIVDFWPLARCVRLQSLNLSLTRVGPDLTMLPTAASLKKLQLETCDVLQSLNGIETQTSLNHLEISEGDRLEDWSPLAQLVNLRRVTIKARTFPGLEIMLGSSKSLIELQFDGPDIGREIEQFESLMSIRLAGDSNLSAEGEAALSGLPELKGLHVRRLQDLGVAPRTLKRLTINQGGFRTLADLPELLQDLRLHDCSLLEDISHLARLRLLSGVHLTGIPKDLNLEVLAKLPRSCRIHIDADEGSRLPLELHRSPRVVYIHNMDFDLNGVALRRLKAQK